MPIRATRKSSDRLLEEASEVRRARARYDVITRKLAADKIAADELTDAEMKAVAEAFGAWEDDPAGYSFVAGDLRTYEGGLYEVLQPHDKQQTWNPVDAVSLWSLKVDYTPEPWTTGYVAAMGEAVTHQGYTWISLAWGNSTEPGTSRFWEVK